MMQKQDRQCFYTKKLLILSVFLFFNLTAQGSQERIGADSQQAEGTIREEQGKVSRRIGILNRYGETQPSLQNLKKLCRALTVENRKTLVKKHQVFQLKGNDSGYELKLAVTDDYRSTQENRDKVRRIEKRLQTGKTCPICCQEFTEIKKKGKIFVSAYKSAIPHLVHYYCYLDYHKDGDLCLYCRGCLVDPKIEEQLQNQTIKEMTKTMMLQSENINRLEKIPDKPSHWVLHIRDTAHDEEITSITGIAAEEWFIIDESVFEPSMEVLETNVDKPEDLNKNHILLLEALKFRKIKFNNEQNEREIFLVAKKYEKLEIYNGERVVFDETREDDGTYLIKLKTEPIGFEGNQVVHMIRMVKHSDRNILVFNKENIDYLKETKSLFIFENSLENVHIWLEGDEIISKEDFENVFVTNDDIGLICDNVNNFSVMKTKHYSLLSPIDQTKILQIKDMKEKNKIHIETVKFILKEDHCFLLPLFDFGATTKSISFKITHQTIERAYFPFRDSINELNEMFAGVEIRGEELEVTFEDYAVIFLFYFSENALNVQRININFSKKISSYEINIIKGFINNHRISKQEALFLFLMGEVFEFTIETNILKQINFQKPIIASLEQEINEEFLHKENSPSIVRSKLKRLNLMDYAIKYLLYFKTGTNEIHRLSIFFNNKSEENIQWMFGILERVRGNGIIFNLPSMDCLEVLAEEQRHIEEMESKFKDIIVLSPNNLEIFSLVF